MDWRLGLESKICAVLAVKKKYVNVSFKHLEKLQGSPVQHSTGGHASEYHGNILCLLYSSRKLTSSIP